MRSYYSPKVAVRGSDLHGRGTFALEPIDRGEIICIRIGPIVHISEVEAVEKTVGDFNFQITDEFFISARTPQERDSFGLFVNHSCEPNVGVFGQISLVAMRGITPDEELTLDYVMIEARDYRLICDCGADKCRKEITGSDWRLPELQVSYYGFFSHFIQQKIDRLRNSQISDVSPQEA